MPDAGDPAPAATLSRTGFWYLRHGETDWNARDLSQGNVEVPLNERGIAQAHAAAAKLRGCGIATIVCSPLSRARVTAEIAAQEIGRPILFDDGLREASYGVKEGHPMADWFATWVAGDFTPEGGESFPALRARGVGAINRALTHAGPVLVVAHGALFRAVRAEMGLDPGLRTPNAVPIFCRPPTVPAEPWGLEYVP